MLNNFRFGLVSATSFIFIVYSHGFCVNGKITTFHGSITIFLKYPVTVKFYDDFAAVSFIDIGKQ